jgi:uncharacterized delta-60 repeat protein
MFLRHRIRQVVGESVRGRSLVWACVCSVATLLALGSAQVARADGELDTGFGTGGKVVVQIATQKRDFARAVAVQADGKIVVGGELGDFSSNTNSSVLVRLNPDGSLDGSFGNGGKVINSSQLHLPALVIQPDDKIVTAAATANLGISLDFAVARYNPDGSLDETFGNNGYAVNGAGNAQSVLLQRDGKIILVGYLPVFRNGSDFLLARFNEDGTPDTTFGTGGRVVTSFTSGQNSADVALWAAFQDEGKIVVSGYTSCISVVLARYNADGTIDRSFGLEGSVLTTNFGAVANRLVIQDDGKLIIGGGGFVVGRYNPDGTIDRSFGIDGKISGGFGNGNGNLQGLVIDQSGRVWAGGSISYTGTGNSDFALARYTPNGSLDSTFGSGGFVITQFTSALDEANALTLQPDGRPILAGYAAEPGGTYVDFALARYGGESSFRRKPPALESRGAGFSLSGSLR